MPEGVLQTGKEDCFLVFSDTLRVSEKTFLRRRVLLLLRCSGL